MHSQTPGSEDGAGPTAKRNSPYVPYTFPGVDSLVPNSPPTATNEDWIRDCSDPAGARADGMKCNTQSATRSTAAARSQHFGGVNASQCDGSVLWIADDIEVHLMARMISINEAQGNIEGYIPK
jgi:hypothetical protein